MARKTVFEIQNIDPDKFQLLKPEIGFNSNILILVDQNNDMR